MDVHKYLGPVLKVKALSVAFETGLIDILKNGSVERKTLFARLQMPDRGLELLLRYLCAFGVVGERRGKICLLPDFTRDICGYEKFVRLLVKYMEIAYSDMLGLRDLLGSNSHRGGVQNFFKYGADEAGSSDYCSFLSAYTDNQAEKFLKAYDFSRHTRVLDIGGNDGTLLAAICRKYPKVTGWCVDLPGPCAIGAGKIKKAGLANRIRFLPGNFFKDTFPVSAGVIVFKSVLHDWGNREAEALVAKAYRSLPPGGEIVVAERFSVPGKAGPEDCLYDLAFMQLLDVNARFREKKNYFSMLTDAGFKKLKCSRPCSGNFYVISGQKPGRRQ